MTIFRLFHYCRRERIHINITGGIAHGWESLTRHWYSLIFLTLVFSYFSFIKTMQHWFPRDTLAILIMDWNYKYGNILSLWQMLRWYELSLPSTAGLLINWSMAFLEEVLVTFTQCNIGWEALTQKVKKWVRFYTTWKRIK
jgi:hypothetical protein